MGSTTPMGRVVVSIETSTASAQSSSSLAGRLRSKGIASNLVVPAAAYLDAPRAPASGCETIVRIDGADDSASERIVALVGNAKAVAVSGHPTQAMVSQLTRSGVEVVLSDRAPGPGRWQSGIWTRSGHGLIRPLQYGLWELATSQRLPHAGGWREQRRAWRHAIDALSQTADSAGLCHLSIAEHEIEAAGAQKPLANLVAELARLCDASRLEATGISRLAGAMLASGASRGAGSVLRRAA